MEKSLDLLNLKDPLREITRKERRMLLASSIVALAVVKIGLVPVKISALGLDLTVSNQVGFLAVLGIVVTYFLLAFVIYGFSDFLVWRVETSAFKLERVNEAENYIKKYQERSGRVPVNKQSEETAAGKVIEGVRTKFFSPTRIMEKVCCSYYRNSCFI